MDVELTCSHSMHSFWPNSDRLKLKQVLLKLQREVTADRTQKVAEKIQSQEIPKIQGVNGDNSVKNKEKQHR